MLPASVERPWFVQPGFKRAMRSAIKIAHMQISGHLSPAGADAPLHDHKAS